MAENPTGPDPDNDGYVAPENPRDLSEALQASPLRPIGDTGLKRSGGYVREEFLPQLSGSKAWKVYKQMEANDPICGAMMLAFSNLVRQVKWQIVPASDTGISKERAEFVRQCLFEDMESSWGGFMGEVATNFVYGFAPMEMVFKIRRGMEERDPRYRSRFSDGRVGIRNLGLRAQDTVLEWDFTEDGDLRGLKQQTYNRSILYIPRERLLLFRTTTISNNPEGKSLLRNAYRSWYFKERLEMIEAIGAERDLAGMPIARLPASFMTADADEEEKKVFEQYKKLVTQLVRDENEGLVLPSDRDEKGNYIFDMQLLGTGGTRQFDTTSIINRYNLQMATSVLADFILLGQRTVGSFALSDNKTDMFNTSLGAYLDAIKEELERRLLPTLFDFNGFNLRDLPEIKHEDVDVPTLEALGKFVKDVTDAGALGDIDEKLVNSLRTAANLPQQVDAIKLPPIHPSTAPKPEKPAGSAASKRR